MTASISEPVAAARVIASDDEAIRVARDFAQWIAPGASDRDRAGRVPDEVLAALGRSGVLGINVPRAHGGAGVSYVTMGEVFRILAAADPAVAQIPQNHFHFVTAIERDGSADQQRFFFAEVMAGARFGNALQERGPAFRITGRMETRLRRDPAGGFRLSGRKYYSTGAATAQWIPVFALDPDDRLALAYVPREASGVEVDSDWHAMGQRATLSGTSTFADVHVPGEHVVPHWRTMEARSHFAAFAQQMHAAIDVGIAQNALADAADYVRTRSRPWVESGVERASDDPHLIQRFGQLAVRVQAAEELLHRAGRELDAAESRPGDEDAAAAASLAVAGAKAFAGEAAVDVANDLFELAGTSATDDRLNLHRHWRNARTHTLHDPNRWKFHHIGNHLLNGTRPPLSGVI
jgi:SfnB family sulfur acquisition oxidoreductase